jgi:hypothetical protein
VKLNIVSVFEVDKLVAINVVAENVRIKSQERIPSRTSTQVVNVANLDVLKNTVNVFKMVKNVVHSVNVPIAAMENEFCES